MSPRGTPASPKRVPRPQQSRELGPSGVSGHITSSHAQGRPRSRVSYPWYGCPVGAWLPCVGWGEGAREDLQRATPQGVACRESFPYGFCPPHPPTFGSQVAAHGPARLRPGRDCKVTERLSSGPQVQAGLTWGPHTHSSCCMLKKYELPRWLSRKESACQFRRREFNPWVGKVLCRRKRQPSPVFLPGKLHGQRSLVG